MEPAEAWKEVTGGYGVWHFEACLLQANEERTNAVKVLRVPISVYMHVLYMYVV